MYCIPHSHEAEHDNYLDMVEHNTGQGYPSLIDMSHTIFFRHDSMAIRCCFV
jgi:hypothetical protein